jgi:hypothetical protein
MFAGAATSPTSRPRRAGSTLATVIDIASRRVVGWATADHLRTDLVADALTAACQQRRPSAPVIFHSDRGCQYTSQQFAALAYEFGVRLSDEVRAAYLEGRSIAVLAREYDVSRGAVRTAVADLMPDHTAIEQENVPAPELPVILDMPGKIADFLRAAELDPAERAALGQGVTVRRGQGYTLRVPAVPAVHRQLLDHCQSLDTPSAIPAQRKARREYENRVSALATDTRS